MDIEDISMNRLLSSTVFKIGALLAFIGFVGALVYTTSQPISPRQTADGGSPRSSRRSDAPGSGPGRALQFGRYSLWWDGIPDEIKENRVETGTRTNIHRADYSGPQACQKCHESN